MKKFLKKHWTTIILVLILVSGLCLLLYPTVSDWWNSFHQSRAIATYVETVDKLSEEQRKQMLETAYAYNEKIAKRGLGFKLTDEELAEYNRVLDITGTGIMGYIQIPSINVNLPIYHGTDEAVLQVAIGHLAGSSLPVGGENTHAAMSGHRGLPSARLFTDLDKLVEGDIFTINVLDQTITYMVNQIRIVLPEEVDELRIEDGEDYCTLITCTPYGVNSHRILVRGTRIENQEEMVTVIAEASRVPNYIVMLAIGIPILFVLLVIMLIYYRRKGPRMSDEQILEELKKKDQ